MLKNTVSTTILKKHRTFSFVWLDLRIQVSKRNITHYSWRAHGAPAESEWHPAMLAATRRYYDAMSA